MTTVGLNQPYYLPYIGLFERIKSCDYFVINPYTPLNRVKAFHRRVKIIQQNRNVSQDFIYLTQCLPPKVDGKDYDSITLTSQFWDRQKEHAKTIYCTYRRSSYFSYLEDLIEVLTDKSAKNLGEFNTKIIKYLASKLNLESRIIDAGEDKRFIEIKSAKLPDKFRNKGTYVSYFVCKTLKADLHLVGQNGPLWLDEKMMKSGGFSVLYQKVKFSPYNQFPRRPSFISGLSVIDLIFNYGPKASNLIGCDSGFVDKKRLLKTTKLTGR